jgi:thiamine biosynthesis lipoprotein
MGTEASIVLVAAPDGLAAHLMADLADLEDQWSRFRPDSDVSRLNGTAGSGPVAVHPDTADLIGKAWHGWQETAGAYDPTVLPALLAAGYDRTFADLSDTGPAGPPVPAPGCGGVRVHPVKDEVEVPAGVALDLGGIGKGYAADLLVARALQRGAAGASVGIGGDVRATGRAPDPTGWVVAVDDADDRRVTVVAVTDGAVVTSSPRRRRWQRGGREQHHLIDPRTGRPADTGCASVTVVAGEAWWGEVAAKAAYLAGPAGALDVMVGMSVTGLVVTSRGDVLRAPGLEAYEL